MNITGIKVIRPTIDVAATASERVSLTYGDTLRVNVSFDYRGPALTLTLYGAIGTRGFAGFDEILASKAILPLPKSLIDFSPCIGSVDIPITSDISPGTDYDLYVKILEYTEAGMPEVSNMIDITGIPPTYEVIQDTIYPYTYVYDGPVEDSIFTFTTASFVPASWVADKLAAAVENETKRRGGRVLSLKVYADTSPLLWTDFRIEVTGTPLGGAIGAAPGIAIGIPIWAIILIVALSIALLIAVITWSIKTITATFTHKPISEEIKKAWSRETLIGAIHDFEEKLERPLTPSEDLEEKSDEELREYCDQLAEVIVPAAISWVPLAILGGLGVLGVGGVAVAYTMSRQER